MFILYAKKVIMIVKNHRKQEKMLLRGIKGFIETEPIKEELLQLLLAGELLHIGKNTSFGFGQYKIL